MLENKMPDVMPPPELSAFFESSPVALALGRPEGDNELLIVNKRFSDLTGYTNKDLAGSNCRILQGRLQDYEARERLRKFLSNDCLANVRTPILNFRKDGTPFVNLLYMSRLRSLEGVTSYILASQFDVSRSHPDRLKEYDEQLSSTLTRLRPIAAESGVIVEGTLTTIANSAATIAQAKLTLANLNDSSIL